MSPDGWIRQHRKVHRIESRVQACRRRAAACRLRIRAWYVRSGAPQVLAWSFVAGVVLSSLPGRPAQRVNWGRAVMRIANDILRAWQLVHRLRATGIALGLVPSSSVAVTGSPAPSEQSDGRVA